MKHINRWLVVILLILVVLSVAACAETSASNAPAKIQPAQVEKIEGTELNRVTLTEQAAARLDLQTAPIHEEQVNGTQRLVVPYSAVIYDLKGATWIYTSPTPLTYVREPITVDYIEGDMVVLVDGPASGTEVVTVGVPELYGADAGIGK
ncbi:MAG: hypothetical protein U0401_08985 [Anaerolineae bacterium]